MPAAGDILHYENFRFENAHVKDKLFIVLHGDPCLMIVTTSQSLRYPMINDAGCSPTKMTFFFPVGLHVVFSKPTYLVMQKIYEIPRKEAQNLMAKRIIIKKTPLPARIFFAIKECLKHFQEDIAEEHWDAIFTPTSPSATAIQSLAAKFNRRK